MGIIDDFNRLVRKDEYEAEEAANAVALTEAIDRGRKFREESDKYKLPLVKLNNELDFMKQVISECVAELYTRSLIVEVDEENTKHLHNTCFEHCMDSLSGIVTEKALYEFANNCSPFVKKAHMLAESVLDKKKSEFTEKQLLSEEDFALVQDFHELENTDDFADALRERVFSVYEGEKEIGEAEKEKMQAIATSLADANATKEDGLTESVAGTMNLFDAVPKTIFSAIYLNKSKALLSESADADLTAISDAVITETVCTYTLLECINSLGLKTFTDEDKRQLRTSFHIG